MYDHLLDTSSIDSKESTSSKVSASISKHKNDHKKRPSCESKLVRVSEMCEIISKAKKCHQDDQSSKKNNKSGHDSIQKTDCNKNGSHKSDSKKDLSNKKECHSSDEDSSLSHSESHSSNTCQERSSNKTELEMLNKPSFPHKSGHCSCEFCRKSCTDKSEFDKLLNKSISHNSGSYKSVTCEKTCTGDSKFDKLNKPSSHSSERCCSDTGRKMSIKRPCKPEAKEFFYLEVFLKMAILDPNIISPYECDYSVRSLMRASIEVGAMKLSPIVNYQTSTVILDEEKHEHFQFNYNTGKTLLISLPPTQFLLLLLKSPLLVCFDIQDGNLTPPQWFRLGQVQCPLNPDLARRCLLVDRVEGSHLVSETCPVMNRDGSAIGTLDLEVSLTCMGTMIVTEIRQLDTTTFVHSNHITHKPGQAKRRPKAQVEQLRKTFQTYEGRSPSLEVQSGLTHELLQRMKEAKLMQKFVESRQAKITPKRRKLNRS